MKKITWLVSGVALAFGLGSCNGGSGAYQKLANGLEYKIISNGKGSPIAYGEVMKFHFAQKYKDSTMKDTYSQPPQYQPVDSSQLPKEYYEVFKQVRIGDSVVTRILTDSVFKGGMAMMPKEFKKGEYLFTTFKILGILKADSAQADFTKEVQKFREQDSIHAIAQAVKDDKTLQDYIANNNIKATKTEKGTYVEIQEAGGEPAKDGQSMSVKYTGKLLDGTVFDSNVDTSFNHTEPYTLTLGAGGSIRGFDDGLRQLGKGAKGRLFIPSVLAYGTQGSGKIKPNSSLIFEIEVLDVKDAAAPQAPPALTPHQP
ncbi:MAG TPA: FKBP-type peptidyl-prolyl cis-trans isomerase [Agriterribacter sp.]|nr:FKBP-type peptidyl-prolyl cis-trans isomerase [Agriterribacter sp.]